MTLYEKYTLVISIAAILVSVLLPLIQYISKKMKRLQLTPLLFDQLPLTLLYNESGSYIKLRFSLECKNKDCTIKSMKVNIRRKSDNQILQLRWSTMESVYINWFGANVGNRINSVSLVRPTKISADTLEPLIVEFSQNDVQAMQSLCSERDRILQEIFTTVHPENIETFSLAIQDSKEIESLSNQISIHNFWFAGEYVLELEIYHDAGKCTTNTFSFAVEHEMEERLRQNTRMVIQCRALQQFGLTPNFGFIDVQAHE